ncbi:Glycine receptor subunit beta-type 4 [Aphelenchoides besseyi]|nr:Glycine receptor subunit beta-type 4 [Aphelenchoides besseyi]
MYSTLLSACIPLYIVNIKGIEKRLAPTADELINFDRQTSTADDINSRLRDATLHFAKTSHDHLLRSEKLKRHVNPFYDTVFSPDYKTYDLCEPNRSGSQTSDLNWSEPADKLFRIIERNGDQNYNMFLPPGAAKGQTTNVSIALYIESMSSVKAQTMDYEVDCYLAMGWYDRRLSHNCSNPILITHKFVAEMLWNPDLYFVNAKYAYLQEVTTPNFMMIVYPDGLVFKSMRTVVTLSCMMDLKYYPVDQQECPLTIQSYAYIENLLNLSWHVDPPSYPIASNEALKLNDMIIKEIKYEQCNNPYTMLRGTGNWSCIRAFIVMKRQELKFPISYIHFYNRLMLFHVVQTYIPSAMLVSISWISFYLPPRASPARISLVITSLLTLTTMSNGARQDLPQVSYISALDIWHFASQALIFLVLLEYSVVSYYITRSTSNCKHRNASISSKVLNGGMQADDLRLRLLNYNGTQNPNDFIGRKSRADSAASLSPRVRTHPAIERAMSSGTPLRSTYSVNTGIGQTINNAAELYATQCNVSNDDLYELSRPCFACGFENEQIAKRIDYYSCVCFPAVFVIFSLTYALYYRYSTAHY